MHFIIRVKDKEYVVSPDEAKAILDIIGGKERYKSCYHSAEGDKPSYYTHHVWWEGESAVESLDYISTATYQKSKLLGKPESNY
jgi:hypothetical protein|tara:strand:+ start:4893 stop:5144 length:252 start_codon:yes stop_codon:yes gene_type:complete